MSDDFPQELRKFLADNVRSVAQLETLLLLRGGRNRGWSAAEVGSAIYMNAEMAELQLNELVNRGLLRAEHESETKFHFEPATELWDRLIGNLADLYRERRVSVITAIYSEPVDKIRTFAEAFRLRKEK